MKNSFDKRDVEESDVKVKRELNVDEKDSSEANNKNRGSEIVKSVVNEISVSKNMKREVKEHVIDLKSKAKQEVYHSSASKRPNQEVKQTSASKKNKRDVGEGSIMETGDSVVKSWKFDVLWPSANLDVTPEQIQTYPERQVTAILEFPRVVCSPVESSADFWLELLYCGHSSGGAVLCDGKNTSSHAHVLYSEQVTIFRPPVHKPIIIVFVADINPLLDVAVLTMLVRRIGDHSLVISHQVDADAHPLAGANL